MSLVLDHLLHRISLVDIKGIKDFMDQGVTHLMTNIHSSLKKLLIITSQAKHKIFDVQSDF